VNYYNEWDSFAAEWLKQLIKDGLIPDGEVDSRSIADVRPEDLKGFTQCHFFAGIGGWSRALQLAGWSPDRPVWTGSPPCQSFSTAGSRKGKDDERHLWPVFFDLIRECQPPTVFGEQVAAAIRFGLNGVREMDGKRSGGLNTQAQSMATPLARDQGGYKGGSRIRNGKISTDTLDGRAARLKRRDLWSDSTWGSSEVIYCRDGKYRPIPTQPALFPLAHGISNRVGILRGAGNAIVPQAAAEIIKAVM
jgi:DNA (cytosine-5)-methyltransferase 1